MFTEAMPTRHDTPIKLPKEDALDRRGFAERVAVSLFADGRTKESVVIALCGSWGDGKTSTKNLIQASASALAVATSKPAPNWVEFSPWQVNGLPGIEKLFFEEIGTALGKAPGKGSPKDRAQSWTNFGNTVQAFGALAEYTGKVVGLAVPGASAVGGLVGGTAKKISEASTLAAAAANTSAKAEGLSDQKQKLRQIMLKLDSPIIVVIDDMDRLGDDEILLVLRLIRANADLPNLTYLLLFQRDVVERSIKRRTGEDGASYLEKFVQVFLDLPKPRIDRIHKTVTDGLTDLVNRLGISWSRFDPERWINLWQPGLSHYFNTMRDAHRYLNVVEFRLAGLVTRGIPEVNMLDVFAMECLRLFEADVHNEVLSRSELFLKPRDYAQRKDAIDALDKVVALACEEKRDAAKSILRGVFPAAQGAYSNMSYDGTSFARWETEARICSENIFTRFYAGELGDSSVSEADVADLIAVKNDRAKCRALIRKQLKKSPTALAFLKRVSKEKCFEKTDSTQGLRLAMWDCADEYPPRGRSVGLENNDASSIPYWLLADALRRMDDAEAKRQFILETMFASQGVFAFIWVADGCAERHERGGFWPQLTNEEVEQIETEAKLRLVSAAKSGKLIRSNHLSALLWGWRRFDSKGVRLQISLWLRKASKADIFFLLKSFVSSGSSWGMESYYVKQHIRIIWEDLVDFAPLEDWKSAVARALGRQSSKKLPEEVALFHQALQRQAAGRSDRGGRLPEPENQDEDL